MLTIGMTHTTIDIKDLKRVKREAVDRGVAINEYLKKSRQKAR